VIDKQVQLMHDRDIWVRPDNGAPDDGAPEGDVSGAV